MLWTRRWDVPLHSVWEAVSTKDGLDRWWLTRDATLDLRPGGRFEHHWTNTVRDVEPLRSITFEGVPGDAASPENVMRFGLLPDGEGTVFTFFDAFQGHPHPLSLPWTCAGWHGTIDALETCLTGIEVSVDFGLGASITLRD